VTPPYTRDELAELAALERADGAYVRADFALARHRAYRAELRRKTLRARRLAWLLCGLALGAQACALLFGSGTAWLAALVGLANGFTLRGMFDLELSSWTERRVRSDTVPS
jgi:hypothetical protein